MYDFVSHPAWACRLEFAVEGVGIAIKDTPEGLLNPCRSGLGLGLVLGLGLGLGLGLVGTAGVRGRIGTGHASANTGAYNFSCETLAVQLEALALTTITRDTG